MGYYTAYICDNGHPIAVRSSGTTDKYCSICGAKIISKCPTCGNTIKGCSNDTYGYLVDYVVPSYCPHCGKPYPWTMKAIDATVAMLHESDLSYSEQVKLIEVLPDVISETPQTQLAVIRFQKAMTKVGSFVADGLRQFAIAFGCELAKNHLGL